MSLKSKVLIFMGLFEGIEEFQKYTNVEYTKDGDSVPSKFEEDFGLEYYCRDLVEKKFIESTSDIELLLKDFSYSDSFQKNDLKITQEYNGVMLIYDFEDTIDVATISKNAPMNFVGEIDYEKIIENKW